MYRFQSFFNIEYMFKLYVDGVTQRATSDIGFMVNDTELQTVMTQIAIVNTTAGSAMVYSIDKEAKKCVSGLIPNITLEKLTLSCIEKDAKYDGKVTMGIAPGGANLPLQAWEWMFLPGIKFQRLVTSDCAPSLDMIRELGPQTGKALFQSDYYFNIQTTISVPGVFDIPDYCKQGGGVMQGKGKWLGKGMMNGGVWFESLLGL